MQMKSQAAGLDDQKPAAIGQKSSKVLLAQPEQDTTGPAKPSTTGVKDAPSDVKSVTPPADSLNNSPVTLPINYWDIHAFTGEGDEIIIVSDRIWVRKTQTTVWKSMLLIEFFGKDFPLEKGN